MGKIEEKLWQKVNRYIPYLKWVPFLRMVAVCNNLAFGKVDEKSDIDIFVVAKRGRLFTVRILVTLILQVFGVRRHGKKVAGRFCLSFFVDDSFLDLSKISVENDVYLAYWVASLKPVIDDGVSEEFWGKNKWVEVFFESEVNHDLSKVVARPKNFFSFLFPRFVENLLRAWQLKRARRKALKASAGADLMVEENILKFHNIDRRKYYRDRWVEMYGDQKITTEKFSSLLK